MWKRFFCLFVVSILMAGICTAEEIGTLKMSGSLKGSAPEAKWGLVLVQMRTANDDEALKEIIAGVAKEIVEVESGVAEKSTMLILANTDVGKTLEDGEVAEMATSLKTGMSVEVLKEEGAVKEALQKALAEIFSGEFFGATITVDETEPGKLQIKTSLMKAWFIKGE